MKKYPKISIIVPTYNRKDKVKRLIDSILISDYPKDKIEIIIVDDASQDNTYEYIKKHYSNFKFIKLLRNNEQKLVAESRNIGLRNASGEFIFFVDDDNVFDRKTLKIMVEFLINHPNVGIIAPAMLYYKEPNKIWCAGVKRNYWNTITIFQGNNHEYDKWYKYPYESDDFPNAFMFRRELVAKVGFFNSKLFPMHYEESDFCNKVRINGFKIVILPIAKIWHDVPPPNEGHKINIRIKNPIKVYLYVRNRILFHSLWGKNCIQKLISITMSTILSTYYLVKILQSEKVNKKHLFKAYFKGITTGLRAAYKILQCN